MKIYIPCFCDDAHDMANPFVYTLTDCIQKAHKDFKFIFSPSFLWKAECDDVNVVHFMWPQIHVDAMKKGYDLHNRMMELKSKGVKVVATCHNLQAHYGDKVSSDSYDIVYRNSDAIIHLGQYSKQRLEKEYPNAKHVLIQHHVYDTIYDKPKERLHARRMLGIPLDKKVAVCIGEFRADEERKMIVEATNKLHNDGVLVIAPRLYFYQEEQSKNPFRIAKSIAKTLLIWRQINVAKKIGLRIKGRYVDDDEMLTLLGAADVVLIQRLHVLNSGNLPLGMYMSKVVVGPDDGNVGQILKETNNPFFDPYDINSVVDAIKRGFIVAEQGKGKENKDWIMQNCTTEVIAEKHMELYKTMVE